MKKIYSESGVLIDDYIDYQTYVKITFAADNLYLFSGDVLITPNATNIAGSVLRELPSEIGQEFNFKTYETSITSMNIHLTNAYLSNSKTVSEYLYTKLWSELIGAKLEVYKYQSAISTILYTGFITNLTPLDVYETEYKIEVEDVSRLLTKSAITENYFDKTSLIAYKPSGFSKIARKADAGSTGSVTNIYNYLETTSDATITTWKSEGDDWWYVLIADRHPVDHVIDILIDMGYNTSVYYDSASFATIKAALRNSVITSFHYELKEPIENAYEYIIKNCLIPLSSYPFINSSGQLELKLIEQPSASDVLITIDESNIANIHSNDNDISNIVNTAIVLYENNFEDNEFKSSLVNFDNDTIRQSVDRFGVLPNGGFSLELLGLNKNSVMSIDDESFATNLSDYIFNRIGDSFKIIKIQLLIKYAEQIEIGDFVVLNHTKLIEWRFSSPTMGQRGLDTDLNDKYAKIDISFWGDYSTNYENNDCFIDAQTNAGSVGKLTWDYNWYIEAPANKAVPVVLPYTLSLPIAEDMIVDRLIKLETFQDILTNYKVNKNFLEFQGVT